MDNTRKRIIVLLICLASIAICVLACFAVSRSYASEQASDADNTELTESATVEQTTAESSDDEIDSLEEYSQYLNGTSNEDYTSSSSYKTNNVNTTRVDEAGEINPDNTNPNIIIVDNEENATTISITNVDHFSRNPITGNHLILKVGSTKIATWTTPFSDIWYDSDYITGKSTKGSTLTFTLKNTDRTYKVIQDKDNVPTGYIKQTISEEIEIKSGKSGAVTLDTNPSSIGKANIKRPGKYDYPDGEYSTGIYKIDDIYAYCSQPRNDAPTTSTTTAVSMDYYNVDIIENDEIEKRITKTLYYAIEYPGYKPTYYPSKSYKSETMTDGYRWVCTHVLLGYLHSKYYDPDKDVDQNTKAVEDACYSCSDNLTEWYKTNVLSKSKTSSTLYKILNADDVPPGFNAFFLYDTDDLGKQDMVFGTWTGGLKITKTSTNTAMSSFNTQNYSLKGAEFTITTAETGGSVVAIIYTDANGVAQIDNLHTGTSTKRTFWVQETKAPPGYALNTDWSVPVEVDITRGTSGIVWTEKEVKEAPQYAKVTSLLKKISDDGDPLANGYFRVTEYAGQYDSEEAAKTAGVTSKSWYLKTDLNGEAKLDSSHLAESTKYTSDDFFTTDGKQTGTPCLPLGTVFVQEMEAPEGYVLDCTVKGPLKITSQGQTEVVQTINNPDIFKIKEHQLTLSKQGVMGTKELPGAKLALDKWDDTEKKWVEIRSEWTSTTEPKVISGNDIVPGKYQFREISAPTHYKKSDPVEFTLNEDGTTDPTSVVLKNNLLVSKKAITGEEELPGAKLQILKNDGFGTLMDEWTSTDAAHEVKVTLAAGKYKLHEVTAPDGYALADDVPFTLNADGTIIVKDDKLEMRDAKTEFKVSKLDFSTEKEIDGAHLQILNSDGGIEDQWNTDKDDNPHTVTGLKIGTYTLKETKVPAKYIKADDIKFQLKADGKIYDESGETLIADNHIKMTDKPTQIFISKVKLSDEKPLAGAVLQLLDKDGEVATEWTTTLEDEEHEITYLEAGEYTLHEASAPEGFVVAEDQKITILDTGVSGKVTMRDDNTKLQVSKKDATGQAELPGAKLRLEKLDGTYDTTWITTANPHTFTELTPGMYKLTEIAAPETYVKAQSIEFELTATGVMQTQTMIDTHTSVEISKLKLVDSTPLVGALLQLKGSDGEVKVEWHSEETAKVVEGLPAGDYTLHEVSAPAGYLVAEDVPVVITDEGVSEPVKMYDDCTMLSIQKKDYQTKKPLAGATFQLWSTKNPAHDSANTNLATNDSENVETNNSAIIATGDSANYELDKLIETWVSTEEPKVFYALPFGTYVLKEVNPPEGWLLGPDVVIDLNEETSQEPIEVEQCDDYTKLEIVKRDVSTGANLECAHLQLQDANGNVVADFITATTPYRIDHLNPGTYWLVEVDPPTGYQKADNVKVVVEETGEIQKAFMDDCKIPETPKSGDNTAGLMALLVMLATFGCGIAYASTRLARSRRK